MVHGDGELVEPGDNLGTDCFNSSHDDSWTGHENAKTKRRLSFISAFQSYYEKHRAPFVVLSFPVP